MKKDTKQDIVFGIHPILELLKAKRRKIYNIYTTKPQPKIWPQISNLLPKYVQINFVSKELLNKLANSSEHQGVVALASSFPIRKKFFDPSREKYLLMLDEIQDPRNLGAILRNAYCTGVNGIIMTSKSSSPITGTVLKASAGLAEHLEIFICPTAKSGVQSLKEAGYSIYLSTLTNKANANDLDYKLPLCLVVGNEATGISKEILNAGIQVTLPQVKADISYNASVAAGILLFLISTKNNIL